jgi:SAM-dependent methyltransferase
VDASDPALAHVARAWDWFTGVIAVAATNLGIELGLFEALREAGAIKPSNLAALLGLEQRPVDAWAKLLVQHGLLQPIGNDAVQLAPGVEVMVCDPPGILNLAPSFAYHARFLARDLLDLEPLFRDGKLEPPARHGAALTRNIAGQTASMHAIFVSAVIPELREVDASLRAGADVLDAGCGSGHLGILLCGAYPGVRYRGYELDAVAVSDAFDAFQAAGLADRADVRCEGVHQAAPASCDLALLFLALHEIEPAQRPEVLLAIRTALRPGGRLVIFDETYPASLREATEPAARTSLHLEFGEMVWGSQVPTRREIEDLCREAGFEHVEHRPVLNGSVNVVLAGES